MSEKFVKEFDELCERHGLGFDDALEALSDAVGEDAAKQTDDLVKGVLGSRPAGTTACRVQHLRLVQVRVTR